jgi:site-specific recombinase XerD
MYKETFKSMMLSVQTETSVERRLDAIKRLYIYLMDEKVYEEFVVPQSRLHYIIDNKTNEFLSHPYLTSEVEDVLCDWLEIYSIHANEVEE